MSATVRGGRRVRPSGSASDGCHIVEQYSTWVRTYVLYAASFCYLFCVLTFRLMNLILFGFVCDSVYVR